MDQPQDEVSLSGEAESQLADPAEVPAQDPVVAERDALAVEKAELQSLLLRRQADYENSRRRAEKERMEHAEYAAMDAVKAFLPDRKSTRLNSSHSSPSRMPSSA